MKYDGKSRGAKTTALPLVGLRVLVGRARHQASALSSGLCELGARVVEIPFIEIRRPRSHNRLDAALKKLHEYDWLVLTSVNGVEAMWDRLQKLRLSRKHLRHLKVAAIGPATKQAIEKRGMKVDVVELPRRALSGCSGAWLPPPKYRNGEARKKGYSLVAHFIT